MFEITVTPEFGNIDLPYQYKKEPHVNLQGSIPRSTTG